MILWCLREFALIDNFFYMNEANNEANNNSSPKTQNETTNNLSKIREPSSIDK